MKKILKILLVVGIIFGLFFGESFYVSASDEQEAILLKDFIISLVKTVEPKMNTQSEKNCLEKAVLLGIIKEEENPEKLFGKKIIRRVDAAVYAERADEILNGAGYNKELYRIIVNKKRISDLSQVVKSKRDAVIKSFLKGIIIGNTNGRYSQNRKFNGNVLVTRKEAQIIAARIGNKAKRKKISRDGQLIRTTKLPQNYKNFEYILASFPNSFYEAEFQYENVKKGNGKKLKEFSDYVRPINMRKVMFNSDMGYAMKDILDLNLDHWCKKVEKNMKCRFNVDYRTIDKKWVNELRSTYYVWENDAYENKKRTDDIKDYVNFVKKHKIIIKADTVVVEPSSIYRYNTEFIRVYVKFKVISFKGKLTPNDLFYCEGALINGLIGRHITEKYFDIGIGSTNGYSKGNDFAVTYNYLYSPN